MSLALISLCLAIGIDSPIPPEKSAKIEAQQAEAESAVMAKYGNKKDGELSKDELNQMAKDLAEADNAVLEKNGIDRKEWARDSLKRSRADYAKTKELVKEIEAKDKAAAEAKKKAEAGGPKEVVIQRGISDDSPVTLDEKPNAEGQIPVEKGLPPEVQKEQEALQEGSINSVPEEAAKPAAKSGKGSHHR